MYHLKLRTPHKGQVKECTMIFADNSFPHVMDLMTRLVQEDHSIKANSIIVSDWQDEESVKQARKVRAEIRALFEKVDRRRKDLKNFIDKKGKEVTAQIEKPIKYLDSQIAIRETELKRQAEEDNRKRQEIVLAREAELRQYGCDVALMHLDPDFCNDEKYQALLTKAKQDFEARLIAEELVRKEQEAKEKELEELRALKAKFDNVPSESTNTRVNAILETYQSKIDLAYRIIELEDELNAISF